MPFQVEIRVGHSKRDPTYHTTKMQFTSACAVVTIRLSFDPLGSDWCFWSGIGS